MHLKLASGKYETQIVQGRCRYHYIICIVTLSMPAQHTNRYGKSYHNIPLRAQVAKQTWKNYEKLQVAHIPTRFLRTFKIPNDFQTILALTHPLKKGKQTDRHRDSYPSSPL